MISWACSDIGSVSCVWLCYSELVHLITHLCETLNAGKLTCVLVIPPSVAPGYITSLFISFHPSIHCALSLICCCLCRFQLGSARHVRPGGFWETGTCGGRLQSDDVRLLRTWQVRHANRDFDVRFTFVFDWISVSNAFYYVYKLYKIK